MVVPTLVRPRVDVQLFTVERVEDILRKAGVPVSRAYLHAALSQQHAGTTPARLNRAVDYLMDHAMAVEGSKGIQWTANASPRLLYAAMYGNSML